MYYKIDNSNSKLTIRVYKYILDTTVKKEEAIRLKRYLIKQFKASVDKDLTVITDIKFKKDPNKELAKLFMLTAIHQGLDGNARCLEDFDAKDWSIVQTRFFIILNYLTGTLEYKDIINLDAKQRTDTGNLIIDKFNELSNTVNTHTVLDAYIKTVSNASNPNNIQEILDLEHIKETFNWSVNAKSHITSSLSENYVTDTQDSKDDPTIKYAVIRAHNKNIAKMYYTYPSHLSSTNTLLISKLIRYFNNLIYSSKTDFIVFNINKIVEMFTSSNLSKSSARNLKMDIKKAIKAVMDFRFVIISNHSHSKAVIKMTMFTSTMEIEDAKDFLKARINPDYLEFIKNKTGVISTKLPNTVYSITNKELFNVTVVICEHYTTTANNKPRKSAGGIIKAPTHNKFKVSTLLSHIDFNIKSPNWKRSLKSFLHSLKTLKDCKITFKNIPDIKNMSKQEVLDYILIVNEIEI